MGKKYIEILTDKDPLLRVKCEPVTLPLSKKEEKTIRDMLRYVVDSRDPKLAEKYNLIPSVGMAAPQVGINKRFFVVAVEDKDADGNDVLEKIALINPVIVSQSEQMAYLVNGEGCLSVKEAHEGYVPRSARIRIKGIDFFTGEQVTIRAKGYKAIVIQHEYDHLSGILFYDRINKNNPFAAIPGAIEIE